MILQIVIPGKPMSGNHAKTPQVVGHMPNGQPRFRNVRTAEAREMDERIQRIALAAVAIAGWKIPDYVRADMWVANCRIDRDNAEKEIFDALEGIVFAHDSRILDGRTIRVKDAGGPRVILHIRPVDGARYGFRKPAKSRKAVPA